MSKVWQQWQQPSDCNGRQVRANHRWFSRPNPRGQIMVSTTSTRVSCPLVGRVSYVFIMSRLSRKYDENKYQRHQPPSLATSITCGNLRTWATGVSKYAVQVGESWAMEEME